MESIALYLEKFTHLTPPEKTVREAVVRAVQDVIGYELDQACIEVTERAIFVNAHPALKTELVIMKEAITERVMHRLGKHNGLRVLR